MKTILHSLAVASSVLLLAGCTSTNNQNSGAMGNDVENGEYNEQSAVPANPDNSSIEAAPPAGPNGHVSRSNPFGLDSGTGMTRQ